MPHDRTRHGTLSDAQTYEARFGEKRSVKEIASAEGVTEQAIHGRIARERQRRQAAGLVVHRSKPGKRRLPRRRVRGTLIPVRPDPPLEVDLPADVPLTTNEVLANFTRAVVDLSEAVARI